MTSQAHRDILPKEHIMATQTRRTTRRTAKFFRATGTASTGHEPLVPSTSRPTVGLKVKTHVKAGSIIMDD
jgi:hypothetical protein